MVLVIGTEAEVVAVARDPKTLWKLLHLATLSARLDVEFGNSIEARFQTFHLWSETIHQV